MKHYLLLGITALMLMLASCSSQQSSIVIEISPSPIDQIVLAQVNIYNEIIASGPKAMENFIKTHDANTLQLNENDFASAVLKSFDLRPQTLQQAITAYGNAGDLTLEEINEQSL